MTDQPAGPSPDPLGFEPASPPDEGPVDLRPLLGDEPTGEQRERVLARLRAAGRFSSSASVAARSATGASPLRVAAVVVAFLVGGATGLVVGRGGEGVGARDAIPPGGAVRDGTPRRDAATGDPVWALTLLGGPAYSEPAAGPERAARVDAYRGWAEQLARRGALVLAEELASPVAVLPIRPPDDPALASPNDAGRGFALGLFLVHAPDADEAASLAEGSPHLGFGGRVAVQPVVAH